VAGIGRNQWPDWPGKRTNEDLARKLAPLEKKYDSQFRVVFEAIRELMAPPEPNKPRSGFW